MEKIFRTQWPSCSLAPPIFQRARRGASQDVVRNTGHELRARADISGALDTERSARVRFRKLLRVAGLPWQRDKFSAALANAVLADPKRNS